MSDKVLIVFGEATAEEVLSAVHRMPGHPWTRIEKVHVELDDPESSVQEIAKRFPAACYHVGIADIKLRREVVLAANQHELQPCTIIDPSAYVDPSAEIAPGCFVAANSVVSYGARLEGHVLVHFNATVGHNCHVGIYSVILPGARLSGHVHIGSAGLIGSNAFIFQGVKIGNEAKVDALTYIHEDLADRRIVSVRRPSL